MNFTDYNEAILYLSRSELLSYSESFDLSSYCSKLLSLDDEERKGRDLIIRVRDIWHKIPDETKPIWNDLTESAGLYPYLDTQYLSGSGLLRFEYHKSSYLDDVYLHEEQQLISLQLQNDNAVVVSAPTSFGKSLLIEEIIASRKYKNITIIQPTLALLDETRKKLLKYRDYYKLVVSTSQQPDTNKGNIFLFTGERVVEYATFPSIDFFVIDEFYKLSLARDDDRAIALNHAFHKLLKHTNKFYLLGPMIENIPLKFKEKFNLVWFPTDFATVAVNEISLEITQKIKAKEKKEVKKSNLFNFLSGNNDQTLIYCSSPNKATALALEYISFIKMNNLSINNDNIVRNNEIQEWIYENINSRWSLLEALEFGIAFHHGALPRHLGSSIVDSFNIGAIKWLFCTSTLIEGVNTSAKTVIMYDKEKGTKQIDFFDYKNIAGRSGRMKKHYIGNVIRFEQQPEQMELFVDIPLFNQEEAPLEILVSLEEDEIEPNVKSRMQQFNSLPKGLQTILKKNSSSSIDGQLKIVEILESNLSYYSKFINWSSFPSYDQIKEVIELAWNNLLRPGENKADIRSPAQLALLTIKYSRYKSISALINELINDEYWIAEIPNEQNRIDKLTFFALNVARHWFDYKLPKWISIISDLQQYVYGKTRYQTGNFSFFATSLEHGFLPPVLSALMEYDIPSSAITKIQRLIKSDMSPEDIISRINKLSNIELSQLNLLPYEINKLRNAF